MNKSLEIRSSNLEWLVVAYNHTYRNKTATVAAGLLKHPRFLVTTKHESVKDFCYIHLDRDTEWGDTHTNTYTVTDEKLILIHRTNNLQYNIIFLPTKMIMTYVASPSQCMNLGWQAHNEQGLDPYLSKK